MVDLAPLSDPNLITQTVATVLGVREGSTRSLRDSVTEHLRHRDILLVLDNCEHLIGACAELAEAMVRGAPHLRILATSREGLGHFRRDGAARAVAVAAGHVLCASHPRHCSSSRRRGCSSSGPSPSIRPLTVGRHHVATIAEICHRLDGIPLAIELAAARVNVLSVEQITSRLKDRFRLLTGGSRTSVARHRTLEGHGRLEL